MVSQGGEEGRTVGNWIRLMTVVFKEANSRLEVEGDAAKHTTATLCPWRVSSRGGWEAFVLLERALDPATTGQLKVPPGSAVTARAQELIAPWGYT